MCTKLLFSKFNIFMDRLTLKLVAKHVSNLRRDTRNPSESVYRANEVYHQI